jgi:hypothetical protein
MLLVTVEEFNRYANMAMNTKYQEDKVKDVLYWAQAALWNYSDYCERTLVYEELHDSRRVIFPKKLPIIEVQKVCYNNVELTEEDYYVYETYIRVPSVSTRLLPCMIKLDYTGGVSRADVEEDEVTGIDTSTIGYKYTIQAQMALKQLAGWALESKRDGYPDEDVGKVRDMIYKYLPKVMVI